MDTPGLVQPVGEGTTSRPCLALKTTLVLPRPERWRLVFVKEMNKTTEEMLRKNVDFFSGWQRERRGENGCPATGTITVTTPRSTAAPNSTRLSSRVESRSRSGNGANAASRVCTPKERYDRWDSS